MNAIRIAVAVIGACMLSAPASTASADGSQTGDDHAHDKLREAAAPTPTISLDISPDSLGGYNLHLVVDYFRFSPENVGKHTADVEGHAHLYVNGEKKARLYGPWFHLPDNWLIAGDNSVRVTLNDNMHSVWAADGKPLAAEATLTKADAFEGMVIERTLGTGPSETIEVAHGTSVRLVLHAPGGTELHLHGYDLSGSAGPGDPVTMTFRADRAGRFPVEAHGVEDTLGRREKTLLYIEVRPE